MSKISYKFHIKEYAKAHIQRDYRIIKESVLFFENPTFFVEENNKKYGYEIKENKALKELYGFPFFIVDFFFSEIDTLSNEEEEKLLSQVLVHLKKHINAHKGYYNIRVPAHITGLIKTYNQQIQKSMMCGGTVSYVWQPSFHTLDCPLESQAFVADDLYKKKHRDSLIAIAKSAFDNYHGQYDISPITCHLAGDIYTQWIEKSFVEEEKISLRVFETEGKPVGFFTVEEEGAFHQIVLSAVSKEVHGQGIYYQLFL